MWNEIIGLERIGSFNHIPGGCNVLYMDGHVEFIRYEQKGKFPVNELFGNLSKALYN
jgi:prepilin-type processing-associated H-X9-DG protein